MRQICLLVAMCVCVFSGFAQTDKLDLHGLYTLAKTKDASYAAAQAAWSAAQEKGVQGRAGLLPTVNLSSGSNKQHGDASFSNDPWVARDVRSWNWNLQLTQPLWRPLAFASYSQSELQVAQAKLQLALAEQELMLRVTQAYLEMSVAQETVKSAVANREVLNQQLVLAERTYKVGTGTITDVYEAKSRLALAQSQLIAAKSEQTLKHAELEKLTGHKVSLHDALLAQLKLPSPEPVDQNHWTAQAQTQQLQAQIAAAAVQIAEREIKKSQASHSPSLDFVTSNSTNATSGSVSSPANVPSRYRVLQAGVNLSIPLYAGGGVSSKVRESIALLMKAEAEHEAAKRQAASLALQAFVGVTNGRAQVESLHAAVQASESTVAATQVGFRTGTRINIDVLNAQKQLFDVQRDLAKARVETAMQALKLKASTHTLSEQDIQTLSAMLSQ